MPGRARIRLLGALFVALAFTLPFGTGAVQADATWLAEAMLERVNEVRTASTHCGDEGEMPRVEPLALDERLSEAARLHAEEMRERDAIDHIGRDGSSVTDRIEREGYTWSVAGENLAQGFETVEAVVDGWLASEDHCMNLMRPAFTHLGVGRADTFWAVAFAAPR